MGQMWTIVIGDSVSVFFVILGLGGACNARGGMLAAYTAWQIVWMGYNAALICYFADVGMLQDYPQLVDLGRNSTSWWDTMASENDWPIDGVTVEYIQAGTQIGFAFIGALFACIIRCAMQEINECKCLLSLFILCLAVAFVVVCCCRRCCHCRLLLFAVFSFPSSFSLFLF